MLDVSRSFSLLLFALRAARFDIARSQNTERCAAYCTYTPEPERLVGWKGDRTALSLCAFANCFQSVAILKGEHASFTIQQQN
jgi:hypothetical protein